VDFCSRGHESRHRRLVRYCDENSSIVGAMTARVVARFDITTTIIATRAPATGVVIAVVTGAVTAGVVT
jgi:hypothetical protein